MDNMAIIYKITNTINNMIYIGETVQSLQERWWGHMKRVSSGEDKPLYNDMREYGTEVFTIEQIDTCFERHKFIIEEYWTRKYQEKGYALYNIKLGNTLSHNTRQRIAECMQNRNPETYQTEEFRQKSARHGEENGMYGKKGADAINGRAVYMLDDDKNIVKIFVSVKHALEFLGIKGHAGLLKACKESIKYKGYYWKKEWIDR